MDRSKEQRAAVQRIYNRDSDYYITSAPHARSNSLTRAFEVLAPRGGLLLDVATGAGHTAFKMAEGCRKVIASDLTRGMIASARKLAAEKKVGNALFLRADSENLGFRDGALDYVSVRIAPHHFADAGRFLREAARVLKPGGKLIYVDNAAPEEPREAAAYNHFEKVRDPSHNRCDPVPVLIEMMEGAGLRILHCEMVRKKMVLDEWTNRPHLDARTKQELRAFLEGASPAIRHWLAPREEEGRFVFDEVEAVILAQRP
ncbi:MAG: class I SAM-dependent methyltransferase [Candidatus Tectomicrobia bacterium]|uniref:Class I SAM-dependent methyltransferase n=1 Tax=Tectimicrobiota bacterium TaxID=2528274 RepID=A0A933E9R1_UNCTE|nr:class I SAM-dependent methyltransferase [Candidatus Tectomicrobia bacterium]